MVDDTLQRPPFVFPAIWEDDDAMFALMQPIKRPKHVDPEAFNRKVDFWSNLLVNYATDQRVLVVSISALQSVFAREFTDENITLSPSCLDAVFDKLMSSGHLKPYNANSGFIYPLLKTGVEYLVKYPATWLMQVAFGQTTQTTDTAIDTEALFVFEPLAEDLIATFITYFNKTRRHKRLTMRLPAYEYDDFESALSEYFPHEASREFVRYYASDVLGVVKIHKVTDVSNKWESKVVWISEKPQTKVPFNLKDKETLSLLTGLAHLKDVIRRHEAEEEKLMREIESRRTAVKKLMQEKRMREAKILFRRTKVLEQTLEKKQTHLHHLEAMILQLDSASDNQQVVQVLGDSSRALQQVTGGSKGLSAVEDTMFEVNETVQESNELSDILTSFGQNTITVADDDELEAELNSLLKPSGLRLPSVPSGLVNSLDEELASLTLDTPETNASPSKKPSHTRVVTGAQR